MKKILIIIMLILFLTGCENKDVSNNEEEVIIADTGEVIDIKDIKITPSKSNYEYNGMKYKKDVTAFDWMTLPFGDNANTVIAKQETNKIGTSSTPEIVIDDNGIHAEKSTQEKTQLGGERSTSIIDWFKKLFSDIGNIGFMLIIGTIVLFILPIIFPIFAPICSTILGIIHKIFDFIVGKLGDFITNLKNKIETTKIVKEQLKNNNENDPK